MSERPDRATVAEEKVVGRHNLSNQNQNSLVKTLKARKTKCLFNEILNCVLQSYS